MIEKVTKKNGNYVVFLKLAILVLCFLTLLFFSIDWKKDSNIDNSFIKDDKNEEMVDENKLINDSQYAFIGFVNNHCDEDHYYPIKVFENIKGELIKEKIIKIKVDNFALDVTSVYLFTAKVINHELIIEQKPNAYLLFDYNPIEFSETNNLSINLSEQNFKEIKAKADEYRKMVDNNSTEQFDKTDEYELSQYDVNYKE